MKKLLLFLICLLPVSAMAQEALPPECRIVGPHKPSADANYQAGVDVHGKPVAPADLNSAPMGMGAQTIVVPLSIDLAQRLQGMNIQGLDMTSTLGFIEVAPNGRVIYNGQDLTAPIHALCEQKPQDSAPAANGQTAPDVVQSAPVSP